MTVGRTHSEEYANDVALYVESWFRGNRVGRATGFLVLRNEQPFLITNWHVVMARDVFSGASLDEGGGSRRPDLVKVGLLSHFASLSRAEVFWHRLTPIDLYDEDGQARFLIHPDREAVDLVAVPLSIDRQRVKVYSWNTDLDLMNPEAPALGMAGRLNVVGFPLGLSVSGPADGRPPIGSPIWSTGFIASDPTADAAVGRHQHLPAFLIDSRTRQGQSGSPVILHIGPGEPLRLRSGGVRERSEMGRSLDILVGVYSGRIHRDSDLGLVWRVELINEIIDGGRRGP